MTKNFDNMNRIFKLLTFMMLAVLTLTACTEDPEETVGSISGYVTIAPKGTEPISGVTVSILSSGQSVTTSGGGTFSFTNLQPGNYSLQLKKTGFITTTKSVNVVAGQTTQCDVQMSEEKEEVNITLNPTSLNFGTTQTDMSVTIKNGGNSTAEWSLNLGDNNWLSASQLGGSIQAGKTQSITFTVDRNYLSEQKTVVVNFQAFGNSYPLTISCAPRNITSTMVVDPTTLNFAKGVDQQTFNIRNTGKSVLTWKATGISTPALSLSSTQGTVASGGSSAIIVNIDREMVTNDMVTTFIISDGIVDQTITVNITTSGNNQGDDDNPGDDDDPGVDPGKLVVTNGLTAYYTLNDNYNDLMEEYDGFGVSDPAFVDGISGQGVKFSKSKENSILIPYGLICNSMYSISFWAKDLSDGVIFYSKCSDNNNRFTLSMDGGFLKFICMRSNNMESDYKKETFKFLHGNISGDKWHHIVLVSDFGTTTRYTYTTTLYVDGKKVSTISEYYGAPNTEYSLPNAFVIGGKAQMYNYSLTTPNFTIDNFRMYDARMLTAEEIKEIYNAKQ